MNFNEDLYSKFFKEIPRSILKKSPSLESNLQNQNFLTSKKAPKGILKKKNLSEKNLNEGDLSRDSSYFSSSDTVNGVKIKSILKRKLTHEWCSDESGHASFDSEKKYEFEPSFHAPLKSILKNNTDSKNTDIQLTGILKRTSIYDEPDKSILKHRSSLNFSNDLVQLSLSARRASNPERRSKSCFDNAQFLENSSTTNILSGDTNHAQESRSIQQQPKSILKKNTTSVESSATVENFNTANHYNGNHTSNYNKDRIFHHFRLGNQQIRFDSPPSHPPPGTVRGILKQQNATDI